jgi:hypothetical protein
MCGCGREEQGVGRELARTVGGAAADVDGDVAAVLEGELDEGRVDGLGRVGRLELLDLRVDEAVACGSWELNEWLG